MPTIDIETGHSWRNEPLPQTQRQPGLRGTAERGWIAGVVLFLVFAGILPVVYVVLWLVVVICGAAFYRLYQNAQQLTLAMGGDRELFLRLLCSPHGLVILASGHAAHVNTTNLRLALMDRDLDEAVYKGLLVLGNRKRQCSGSQHSKRRHRAHFTKQLNFGEADYEALLELDNEPPVGRSQLSEAELGRLRTHIHHLKAEALPKRPPRPMPGSASSCMDKGPQSTGSVGPGECSVCLEGYPEASRVTTLPCKHSFHAGCIEPWLRQQGTSATCPLCKRIVFGPP